MEGVDLPVEHGALRVQYHLNQGGSGQETHLVFAQPFMGSYDSASGNRHGECLFS